MNKFFVILSIFVLSVINTGYTQNLILNGSFEEVDYSKVGYDMIPHWQPAGDRSPDFFFPPYYNNPVDTTAYGIQLPQHGQNYSGAGYYWFSSSNNLNNFYRELIITTTNLPLITGTRYCFSFYISLADIFNCGINRIDAIFSDTIYNPYLSDAPYLIYNEPQWMADTTLFYTDKENWIRIEGNYIATGGEKYITIGNLHLDDATDTICNGDIEDYPDSYGAYYFMDNFSLEEIKPVVAGSNTTITVGNSTVIGNNSDSASTYTWSPNYFIDDTNAVNPTVNPPQTTTYYVTKTQCGVITTDSITVFVTPIGISEYYNNPNIDLYPNPNKGVFNINYNFNKKAEISFYNILGEQVKVVLLPANKTMVSVNMSNFTRGIYTYKVVENKKLIAVSKFLIQ